MDKKKGKKLDFYYILELTKTATPVEIKFAYRKLALVSLKFYSLY